MGQDVMEVIVVFLSAIKLVQKRFQKVKNLNIFLVLLVAGPAWSQYSATATHFVPLPLEAEMPWRISTLLNMANRPSLELELALVCQLGAGFEVGFGTHGGVLGNPTAGSIGLDLMFRFLKYINSSMFLGIHTQAGYVYTGLGDVSVTPAYASALPVNLGLIYGGAIQEKIQLYFFPVVEFGQTMKGGDPVWKSGVGLRFTLGTAIDLSDTTHLILEMRPKVADLTDSSVFSTFGIDGGLGVLFEF